MHKSHVDLVTVNDATPSWISKRYGTDCSNKRIGVQLVLFSSRVVVLKAQDQVSSTDYGLIYIFSPAKKRSSTIPF